MKIRIGFLVGISLLFVGNTQLQSQGYIVANGVTFSGFNSYGYQVQVIQNPTNSDYTGFFFVPQGGNTFLFSPFVDESVRIFMVSANGPIDLQSILSQSYQEVDGWIGGSPYQMLADGVPFYLGFYTGYNPWDSHGNYTGIYSNPVFGWGEFVNDAGVIQMLDSALEIEGGGIYAGTQTIIPVPEPSTFALLSIGSVFLAWRRWRTSPPC